jgi:hypothetical protein
MEALLAEMLKTIKTSRTTPDQIDLPTFHPDSDDAKTWIGQIGEIKNEFSWTDLQVLVRVGRFLSGESKGWFDSWSPLTRDWRSFERDFLEAFPPKKILGRLLNEASYAPIVRHFWNWLAPCFLEFKVETQYEPDA